MHMHDMRMFHIYIQSLSSHFFALHSKTKINSIQSEYNRSIRIITTFNQKQTHEFHYLQIQQHRLYIHFGSIRVFSPPRFCSNRNYSGTIPYQTAFTYRTLKTKKYSPLSCCTIRNCSSRVGTSFTSVLFPSRL